MATDGYDLVTSYDSAENDRLLLRDDRIIMTNPGHTHVSIDFEMNQVIATGHPMDVAYLFDSDGDDQVEARPESTSVTRADRQMVAHGFPQWLMADWLRLRAVISLPIIWSCLPRGPRISFRR